MIRQRLQLSDEFDLPLLEFLWRWKVMTTAGLSMFLAGTPRSEAGYRRIMRLARGGLVIPHANTSGKKFVWTLTSKGFAAVRGVLPQLREEGFKSEAPSHDLLVAATQLGPWVHKVPSGVTFCTEQELRRYDPLDYPEWVPQTCDHRPDGYWHVPVGDNFHTLALEVELSHQAHTKYEQIAAFYASHKKIYRVVWVVPRPSLADKIRDAMASNHGPGLDYHAFVTFGQLSKHGWQCPIDLGKERGQVLAALLVHSPSICPPSMETQWMLDARKSPHTSLTSRPFELRDFRV